jgi:surface antigen
VTETPRQAYNARRASGEAWCWCYRVLLALAATAFALQVGACGISFPIASLVPDDPPTGAVAPKAVSPLSAELGEEDWRRAKAALAVALDPQGNGSSVSWDNPQSAMKGVFTPAGKPFVKDDEICRTFSATIVGQASTASLQGTGCRPSGGEWTLKGMKPRKKPA